MSQKLAKPYTDIGLVAYHDLFLTAAMVDYSTEVFVVDSIKKAGVMFVDVTGKIRLMVNPILRYDEVLPIEEGVTATVTTVIVNGSNTGLYPLLLGPQAM